MGLLDVFDQPDTLSALLGIPLSTPQSPRGPGIGSDYAGSPDGGYATMAPMPPARPDAAPPRDAVPNGSDIAGTGADQPNLLGGRNFLVGSRQSPGLPVGQPPAQAPVIAQPQTAPALPPAQDVGYAPGNAPQVPLPQARPPMVASAPGQNVPLPPQRPADTAAIPPAAAAAMAAPASTGMPGAPGQGPAPALIPSNNGLASALGIPPSIQTRIGPALAGLGKGLSAVGSLPAGASKGQAIAAGAGGALTGGYAAEQQEKQRLFTNQSTYFKDYLSALNSGDKQQIDSARANLFNAQAQAIMTGKGKNGTQAWQATPYGKLIQVENEAQKYEKGQQILLQKQWQMNGTAPDEQQKQLEDLNTKVNGYRGRLYKAAGIDPQQADKMRTSGTEAKNPIDTSGMNEDAFNAMVPMGAWYQAKGADGKVHVLQRTKPPAGSGTPASPQTGVTPEENAAVLRNAGQE